MKIEITKEEFVKLVEQMLYREKILSELNNIGLSGLIEDLYSKNLQEETLLDAIIKNMGRYDEYIDDVFGRLELPTVEYIVNTYWVE